MSYVDATLIQVPIDAHQPALMAHEATVLRRLRSDALGLLCLFDASRTSDDWVTSWAGWARHRQAWRFVLHSARTRLLQLRAFDVLDPDITTERAASVLDASDDAHTALFWSGMWVAASRETQWSQVLQLDASDDVDSALGSYLGWIQDREADLQLRLAAYARRAVLESTGDTSLARQSSFESADWGGSGESCGPFLLTVRIR